MVKSKDKGNHYEQKIAGEFRLFLGMGGCVTSRSESKSRDDEKVDLCNTDPFNVQCKAWERAPSYHDVLSEMPEDGNINVIFHKRNRKGDVVVMRKEDFYKLAWGFLNAK